VVATGAVILVRLSRSRREEEERRIQLELQTLQLQAELTQARLSALKSQLRPHFLFNALNSISALARSGDTDLTIRTIARLGDLLRATLELPENETIALSRELELVDQYLGLERLRFADRLETSYDVKEDCRSVPVPALILQPLVENSIRHGVARCEGKTRLVLRARRDNGSIRLEVNDSGPGFSSDGALAGNGGVGLTNVKARLLTKYGDQAKLTVSHNDTGGASVRLTIPLDDEARTSDN
jgi:LytS/YehU family sensor histidine kinase